MQERGRYLADIKASNLLTAVQAKGAGYAISQSQELEVIKEVAESSGGLSSQCLLTANVLNTLTEQKCFLQNSGLKKQCAVCIATLVSSLDCSSAQYSAPPIDPKVLLAVTAGIVLDPTYSGKALYGFLKDVKADTEGWKKKRILFLHTGGLLSMFDKVDQLQPILENSGKTLRHPIAAV